MGRSESDARTDARRIVAFVEALEGMKRHTRTAWSSDGRRESIAEHSWRLTMFAMAAAPLIPGVDANRLLRLCLVHDLGEVLEGDVSAYTGEAGDVKEARERDAVTQVASLLGGEVAAEIHGLWEEYTAATTAEARVAKALDKLETIIQHNQGANPPDFDYAWNLEYGASLVHGSLLIDLIRELVDERTRERADAQTRR